MSKNNKYQANLIVIMISLLSIIVWSFFYDFIFKQYEGIKIYWFFGASIILTILNKKAFKTIKINYSILALQLATCMIFFLLYNWSIYYSKEYQTGNIIFRILTGEVRWNSFSSVGYFLNLTVYDLMAFIIFSIIVFVISLSDTDKMNSNLKIDSIININYKYGFFPILFALIGNMILHNILASIEYKYHYDSLSIEDREFWNTPGKIFNLIAIIKGIVMLSIQVLGLYYMIVRKKIEPLKALIILFGIVFLIAFIDYMYPHGFNEYLPNFVLGLTISEILALILILLLSKKIKVFYAIPITYFLIHMYNKIIILFIFNPRDIYKAIFDRYELIVITIISGIISGLIYYLCQKMDMKLTHANTRS